MADELDTALVLMAVVCASHPRLHEREAARFEGIDGLSDGGVLSQVH